MNLVMKQIELSKWSLTMQKRLYLENCRTTSMRTIQSLSTHWLNNAYSSWKRMTLLDGLKWVSATLWPVVFTYLSIKTLTTSLSHQRCYEDTPVVGLANMLTLVNRQTGLTVQSDLMSIGGINYDSFEPKGENYFCRFSK